LTFIWIFRIIFQNLLVTH